VATPSLQSTPPEGRPVRAANAIRKRQRFFHIWQRCTRWGIGERRMQMMLDEESNLPSRGR
jgi:hypothetical protein